MKSKFTKAAFLLICFGIITSKAFGGGIISGQVEAKSAKYKKDVVVYLKGVKGKFTPSQKHEVMDQKNLVFIPHVLAVPVGTTVDFKNSDNVNHNVFSPADCKKFNLGTYTPGMSRSVKFDEACVVDLLCNVHSEMSAYVVVVDNPYFDVTSKDGNFTIKDVPTGTYEITAWSEKLKPEGKTTVTVVDGQTASVNIKLVK